MFSHHTRDQRLRKAVGLYNRSIVMALCPNTCGEAYPNRRGELTK